MSSFRDRGDGFCSRCGRVIGWHAGTACFSSSATGMPAPSFKRGTLLELGELVLADVPVDPEYADVDEAGQLGLGIAGEQRAIPGLGSTAEADRIKARLRDARARLGVPEGA